MLSQSQADNHDVANADGYEIDLVIDLVTTIQRFNAA